MRLLIKTQIQDLITKRYKNIIVDKDFEPLIEKMISLGANIKDFKNNFINRPIEYENKSNLKLSMIKYTMELEVEKNKTINTQRVPAQS